MELIFENELPYNALNEIGIDKRAFLNLPTSELDKLMTGRLSPLMECAMKTNGREYKFLAKILLQKNNSNNVDLKVYPIQRELKSNIALTKKEIALLSNGGVVQKRINDEKRSNCYIQLDRETNNLITANVNQIYIPDRFYNVELSKNQLKSLKKGEPIEIISDKLITVGVDLESPKGINIVEGNLRDWKNGKQDKLETLYFLRYENNSWIYVPKNEINKNISY